MQRIIEAVPGSEGRQWDVLLIQAGTSLNGNHYPSATLREATPLFDGVYAYTDHSPNGRSIRDKVGRFSSPAYGAHEIGGQMVEGIQARFKVISPWLREVLLEASNQDEADFVGFSIDAIGSASAAQEGGKRVNRVDRIEKVRSVDVVSEPAAGGRLIRLVASAEPMKDTIEDTTLKETTMDATEIQAIVAEAVKNAIPTQAPPEIMAEIAALREQVRVSETTAAITQAIAGSSLSAPGKERARKSLLEAAARRALDASEIQVAISEATEYEGALVGQANPDSTPAIIRKTSADKIISGLMGFFEQGNVDDTPRFRSIREAYTRFIGADAFDVSGVDVYRALVGGSYDSALDHRRVTESLTTASWADVFGDVMYKQMMKQYNASNYGIWRQVVSDIEPVPDFMTRHWVRIGGYANLSSVDEQATYPQITSPGDEEIEYHVTKYGGIEDVTLETIVNDRVGAIRRIPGNMARAAARTLYTFVFNLITTDDPTMDYDSTALYTTHGNSGTAALSLDGLNSAVIAMRDQTAYGETSEILGSRNFPKFLIVPNELEALANRIISPSGSYGAMILDSDAASSGAGTGIDPQQFANKGIQIIVLDHFTDANDWYLVANPAEVPTVVMGFLNGREDPEMFVQDQPTVGSVFTADKISYKIRHIYGGDVADHRSFYRQVVT